MSDTADKRTTVTIGDQTFERGPQGATHQTAGGDIPTLTTQQGVPVADDQNSLKAGPRGGTLLEDFHFREKIFHFDHERIPERVVHARGYGAHGFFELTDSSPTTQLQASSEKPAPASRHSSASQPSQVARAHSISPATSAVSP